MRVQVLLDGHGNMYHVVREPKVVAQFDAMGAATASPDLPRHKQQRRWE